MKQKLLTLIMLLVVSVTGAWGEDITIAPTLGQNQTTLSYGLFIVSHSSTATSSGSKISGGAITTGSNGDEITINFQTTKSDMYIKSVTFNSLSNGTLDSDDGTISDNTLSVTGNSNNVSVVLSSTSSKKGSVKITSVVVNTGTNNIETITFSSASSGTVSFTSKMNGENVTSAISSITSNGNPTVSSNILSWPNNKTLVFTSSNNIKYLAFLTGDDKLSATASPDTYANAMWTGTSKTITFTNNAGGGRTLKNVYVITEAETPKTATTTVIDASSISELNKDLKNGTAGGTLTATVTPEGASALASPTITWSSSNTSVATIGETTGVVTLVGVGSTDITASYEGDETYAASNSEAYSLTVTDTRTAINPSLSYDNSTLILGATTTANPTLTGNTGGGAVTYSSDAEGVATVDAETGVITAVAAGTAHITATIAAIGTYQGGSAQATITVATNPLGTNKTITWTLSPLNSSNASLTSSSKSTSIYLKNIGEIDLSLVSLNSTPSSAKDRTAKIDRTEGKDNGKYVSVTFDVEDGYYFIPSSVSIKVANVANVTTFDAELVDEYGVSIGETGKSFASTNGAVETWDIANSDKSKKMSGTVTLKIYGYAETAGTYRFGNQFVITGSVIPQPISATIPTSGWGSYCSSYALDFSDAATECEAYAVSAYDVENLTVTYAKQTGVVPAGTGILLKGDTGAASIVVSDEAGSAPAVNKLVGFIAATDYTKDGATRYLGLSGGNWKEMNAGTIPANKAVLEITASELTTLQEKLASGNAKFTIIFDEGQADGIASIENGKLNIETSVYNLAGQKVDGAYKGIVIVNGKKVKR